MEGEGGSGLSEEMVMMKYDTFELFLYSFV